MLVPLQKLLLVSAILAPCAVKSHSLRNQNTKDNRAVDAIEEAFKNDRVYGSLPQGENQVFPPRPGLNFDFPEESVFVLRKEADLFDRRQLQNTCPGLVGNILQCQTGLECSCDPPDLKRSLFNGTCHYCAFPDGAACSRSLLCKADVSYCSNGFCTSLAATPLYCPVLLNESISCIADSRCQCESDTPNQAAITSGSNTCYVCHAKLDEENCTEQAECSPSSFCDIATGTCLPETACSTRDSQGFYSCNPEFSCTCGGETPYKTVLPFDANTSCYLCFEVADGDNCTATSECSPRSYCDEATKTCVDNSACPALSSSATYACITNSSTCSCVGRDHDLQVAIPHSQLPGTFCHVCTYDDFDSTKTCTDWTDCKPASKCELATGTCVPDSTCVYTENEGRCSSSQTCTCPNGRTRKEHEQSGGGTCYSCELD